MCDYTETCETPTHIELLLTIPAESEMPTQRHGFCRTCAITYLGGYYTD